MITLRQYFTNPTTGEEKLHTQAQADCAEDLLARVHALRAEYRAATGALPDVDPDTGTEISGSAHGAGDGGFRLPGAATGKTQSSHKVLPADAPAGAGVDGSDQRNEFDAWLDTFEGGGGYNSKLEEHGLYREHPDSTPTWCHLTTRAPRSGRRTFHP